MMMTMMINWGGDNNDEETLLVPFSLFFLSIFVDVVTVESRCSLFGLFTRRVFLLNLLLLLRKFFLFVLLGLLSVLFLLCRIARKVDVFFTIFLAALRNETRGIRKPVFFVVLLLLLPVPCFILVALPEVREAEETFDFLILFVYSFIRPFIHLIAVQYVHASHVSYVHHHNIILIIKKKI